MSLQRHSYIWKIYRSKRAIGFADVGKCLQLLFNYDQEQRSKGSSASSSMSSSAFEKKSGSSHLVHAMFQVTRGLSRSRSCKMRSASCGKFRSNSARDPYAGDVFVLDPSMNVKEMPTPGEESG